MDIIRLNWSGTLTEGCRYPVTFSEKPSGNAASSVRTTAVVRPADHDLDRRQAAGPGPGSRRPEDVPHVRYGDRWVGELEEVIHVIPPRVLVL